MTTKSSGAIDSLQWRYATKKFDNTKKISQDLWEELEETLKLSPSSFGLQPYRFVIVTDQKIKNDLVAAAWNQAQVAECSHFVVFARLTEMNSDHVQRYIELIAETRNVSVESLKMMQNMMNDFIKKASKIELENWMEKQCYIALGNLMTAASLLRIDNCPMEGIVKEEVDRILQLPEKGCHSVVSCALGYRAEDDKYGKMAKVRFPSEELFIRV